MTLTFKIKLRGSSKPPIWRKIKVNDSLSFDDLHLVIQMVFKWNNSHLYQFSPKAYGSYPIIQLQYDDAFNLEEDFSDPRTFPKGNYYDATFIQLKSYFKKIGQKLNYIYDFGDDWQHIIELTDISDEHILRPQLIGGKAQTPPEDCGGIDGYYHLVEVVNDAKHPEHNNFRDWLALYKGEKWDLNMFDLKETNALLQNVWDDWVMLEDDEL